MESDTAFDEPAEPVSALLRKFSFLIVKTARQEMIQTLNQAGIDLPPQQFMVLVIMGRRTLTLGELSREMDLDPSTLAPIIEQFVRRGLVERNRDVHDRRRVPLTLTAKGLELLTIARHINDHSPFDKSLALMGEEKKQQLVCLLDEFVTNLLTLSQEAHSFNDATTKK